VSRCAVVVLVLAACGAPRDDAVDAAAPDGAALVADRCTGCHDLAWVARDHGDVAGWTLVVDRMMGYGCHLDLDERTLVIAYLAEAYP
jgi:hypothetical protein